MADTRTNPDLSDDIPTPGRPGPGPWKCGDEWLPFHPSASHVPPEYRDGWNRAYYAARSTVRAPVGAPSVAHIEVHDGGAIEYGLTKDAHRLPPGIYRLYASAQEATPQQGEWRPIESAPKYERLLLWFPAFGPWIASAWPGSWYYAREQWVIHSPFGTPDGKALFGTDAPQPTHWMPLLNPPASLQQHDQQEGA